MLSFSIPLFLILSLTISHNLHLSLFLILSFSYYLSFAHSLFLSLHFLSFFFLLLNRFSNCVHRFFSI
jgi:hypothetical protein